MLESVNISFVNISLVGKGVSQGRLRSLTNSLRIGGGCRTIQWSMGQAMWVFLRVGGISRVCTSLPRTARGVLSPPPFILAWRSRSPSAVLRPSDLQCPRWMLMYRVGSQRFRRLRSCIVCRALPWGLAP